MSKIDFMSLKTIDFCDDVRDGTHDSPKHLDSGKLLITSKNIKGDSIDFENASYISEEDYNKINERSLVEINDVLYSMIGTVGLVYRVDQQPNYAIKNMGLFKIHDELKSKWLYYYLNSPKAKGKVLSMLSGSTQKFISLSNLRNLEIEFPQNIDDAKRIIKICESIDKKIKLNNEINNNLYKLIKNNYESLINGCNWEEVELGAISNITSGKRPVDKSETGEYPVIGANGIMAYACDYNFNEDLIITGRVGTLGVVKRYLDKIWASDNTLVIQTKYLNYIENYLKTIDYYSLNRGSTQPLLTQGDLKKQIIYFNEESVTKFEKDNQIFVDKIRNNEKENSKLIQLRDTLLPKLMNGEIDLDNIEI